MQPICLCEIAVSGDSLVLLRITKDGSAASQLLPITGGAGWPGTEPPGRRDENALKVLQHGPLPELAATLCSTAGAVKQLILAVHGDLMNLPLQWLLLREYHSRQMPLPELTTIPSSSYLTLADREPPALLPRLNIVHGSESLLKTSALRLQSEARSIGYRTHCLLPEDASPQDFSEGIAVIISHGDDLAVSGLRWHEGGAAGPGPEELAGLLAGCPLVFLAVCSGGQTHRDLINEPQGLVWSLLTAGVRSVAAAPVPVRAENAIRLIGGFLKGFYCQRRAGAAWSDALVRGDTLSTAAFNWFGEWRHTLEMGNDIPVDA